MHAIAAFVVGVVHIVLFYFILFCSWAGWGCLTQMLLNHHSNSQCGVAFWLGMRGRSDMSS